MQGLRTFIPHPNPDSVSHPTTQAILHALDAAVDDRSIITLLGKAGTGKSRLLTYWAWEYWLRERKIQVEHLPIIYAEVDETEKKSLGKGVYATATACVTFSDIIYRLGEIAIRHDGSKSVIPWYREERSLYTDQQFRWLFDQVCRELRRLGVSAIIIDNAHRLDTYTMRKLMVLRQRLLNQVALVFGAQLAKNEQLDEPMGTLFEQARVDPLDCEASVELKPLTEAVFYDPVVQDIFVDIEAEFEEDLERHFEFIATTLWKKTGGDWKSINSRVKHFNRLLGPRIGHRVITRKIIEQVLGKTLPENG